MIDDKIRISVIIPTLNEEKHIGTLLDCVKSQTFAPFEVLVVDGKSSDATQEIAKKHPDVKLIRRDPHVARQRNAGAAAARGNILCFFDADVTFEADFLERCVQEMQSRSLTVACPHYSPPKTSKNIVKIFFSILNWFFRRAQKRSPSGGGNCIIVDKQLFEECGGFPNIRAYEDIQLIQQLGAAGKFGIVKPTLYVSDRRFHKYGAIKTIGLYIVLGFLFAFRLHKIAAKIEYEFNNYA